MSRVICFALCLTLTVLASQAMALAPTYGPVLKLGTAVDESTMSAKRRQYVAPVYPEQARLGHIEESVVFHANIDAQGKVAGLQTISGNPLLIRAALEAARQ
jgi:outer membrane biosynthesis protein TonB